MKSIFKNALAVMFFAIPFSVERTPVASMPPFDFVADDFLDLPAQAAPAQKCFDPLKNEIVRGYLEPLSDNDFNNPDAHSLMCELKHAWTEYGMDPRLVLFRLIGESGGNPKAVNRSSGAYGLYQQLGGMIKRGNHAKRIKQCQNNHRNMNPFILQTSYYVNEYIRYFKRLATYGCKKGHEWEDYSVLERLSYLGVGSCSLSSMKHTQTNLCNRSAHYRNAGCKLMQGIQKLSPTAMQLAEIPLCKSFLSLDCPAVPSEEDFQEDPNLWCSFAAKYY